MPTNKRIHQIALKGLAKAAVNPSQSKISLLFKRKKTQNDVIDYIEIQVGKKL